MKKTERAMKPESLMMSYGYDPQLSEGSVKCPIFQTSTFAFKNAEEGKRFFEVAHGMRKQKPKEVIGLIYSRVNNPDMEILEDRLTLWDETESAAVFESGMAAVTTSVLEFVKPGDLLLHSNPVYGGTNRFFHDFLKSRGVKVISFLPKHTKEEIIQMIKKSGAADKLAMIFIETPGNPTNDLIDMNIAAEIAKQFSTRGRKVITAIDNTFLGPVFQHPKKFGMDLIIYSATKYIGGHSDLVAGAVCGSKELIDRVKMLRSMLGNMAAPLTGWLLMRSLETLKMRMECMCKSAEIVANYLNQHPKVEKVRYLALLKPNDRQYEIYKQQCLSPGAMISFDIKGKEKRAFKFLNSLKLVRLAVSLGSTESLIEHPKTMTHSDVEPEILQELGVDDTLIRLSIGVEDPQDIIWDLEQALKKI